jgi:thiamine biosynthesis lipoprotein
MIRALLLALMAAALASAGCRDAGGDVVSYRLFAMGTSVELTAPASAAAALDSAMTDVETLLGAFERDYYAWGDGELAALNAALAEGTSFDVSNELAALLVRARDLAALSDGTFEPGVAPLVEAWGFHDASALPVDPPSAATIAAILDTYAGIAAVRIEGSRISAPQGPVRLDLGGIAKGRAVDRIVDLLAEHGMTDVLVDAGGDLRVLGHPPGRRWRIGIQAPRAEHTLGTIELGDGEAAFTSGDYERFYDTQSGRRHHLIDPGTGYPATHTQAVTVVAKDGTTADAAATALFVAGPDRWRDIARALGVTCVLRVDASGTLEVTQAMRDRLQISPEYPSDIIAAGP